MKMLTLSLAISLASLIGPAVRQVKACSPVQCRSKVRAPSLGNVPGNALVIPVDDPSIVLTLTGAAGAVPLLLKDVNGEKAWVPTDVLPEGNYQLTYDEPCAAAGSTIHGKSSFFVNSGPSAYPTALGAAGIANAGISVGGDRIFADVHLEADGTFGLFSGLATINVTVDGLPVSSFNMTDNGNAYLLTGYCGQEPRTQPDRDSCGGVTTVAPGVHRVTFSGSVTGSPTPLPDASIDVRLDCAWLQSVHPELSPTPRPPSTTPAGMAGGCSLTPAETLPTTASLPWLALGLAFTVFRPRRR
jgi:hypothetical protein